jgi:hypothetical protein
MILCTGKVIFRQLGWPLWPNEGILKRGASAGLVGCIMYSRNSTTYLSAVCVSARLTGRGTGYSCNDVVRHVTIEKSATMMVSVTSLLGLFGGTTQVESFHEGRNRDASPLKFERRSSGSRMDKDVIAVCDLQHRAMLQTKRVPHSVAEFPDIHAAIDGLLDAWLPRLIVSNEILFAALVRVRDYHLAGAPETGADGVLADVEAALERAARAQNGF